MSYVVESFTINSNECITASERSTPARFLLEITGPMSRGSSPECGELSVAKQKHTIGNQDFLFGVRVRVCVCVLQKKISHLSLVNACVNME